MNQPIDNGGDGERELFARLEADLTGLDGGEVLDLAKARTGRGGETPWLIDALDSTGSPEGSSVYRTAPDQDQDDEEGEGDGAAAPARPADPPDLPKPGITLERRNPIVPEWLRSKPAFVATAQHTASRWGYTAAFHSIRTPYYGIRLAGTAPVGAVRFLKATGDWVWDRDMAPLRAAAVKSEDAGEYMMLTRARDRHVRWRTLVWLTATVFGLVLALSMYVLAPGYLLALAGATVLALGWAGQRPDKPVIGPAVVRTELEKLTTSIVLRALGSIGNAAINKALAKGGEGIKFTSEITRDGPGYRAELDLPYGVTPDDVMESRKALASGLRRKLGCVWPAPNPDSHEGALVLWVGDRPMNETKKPAWPLLKAGQVNLFEPVVFGNDQRMAPISVTLMFASVVVGSIPRMGKTFLMRLLLLIGALDPRAELYAFEFKGTGDFGPLEPVCHRYRSGEEDEDIKYVRDSLLELKAELTRRAKVIKTLPRAICPENKVTNQLANDRALGLHPIMVALDECQKAFEHPEFGGEIELICEDITKRGPALGIIGMFGTQRPDAKSLPTGISANAVLRFCLKVMGQPANDMVLGTSMYKAGYRATMFSRSDRGIAWMVGEGDDPRIVCSAFLDAVACDTVVVRARTTREQYGNITGHALGLAPKTDAGPTHDLLADILSVVPVDEEKVWNEKVAVRLADLRPEVYGGWKGETVTANLKPFGITVQDVWGTPTGGGKGTTRRGIARADITTAHTERKRSESGG
ncbi:cell division protein FtsK [Streptacidiphilus carbonis]|uniref:cell division protein FtsK n=1 Tax=Streptacidiphilus carbonis TaxID=105422 RepID=UPI000AB5D396|nr:cell division protein FtsK [Streptacidiphilus carbonis]